MVEAIGAFKARAEIVRGALAGLRLPLGERAWTWRKR